MKNFLFGLMLLPAIVGVLFIYHTLLVEKSDGQDGAITNRIIRLELAWLAINKPHSFIGIMPELRANVSEKYRLAQRIKQRALLKSSAFDYDYFIAHNKDLAPVIASGENAVKQYWVEHLNECRKSSPVFNVRRYQEKYPDIVEVLGKECEYATYHWLEFGISEGRSGM